MRLDHCRLVCQHRLVSTLTVDGYMLGSESKLKCFTATPLVPAINTPNANIQSLPPAAEPDASTVRLSPASIQSALTPLVQTPASPLPYPPQGSAVHAVTDQPQTRPGPSTVQRITRRDTAHGNFNFVLRNTRVDHGYPTRRSNQHHPHIFGISIWNEQCLNQF